MNYKLYKPTVTDYSALQQFLYNRGIEGEQQEKWLNAGWEDIWAWDGCGTYEMWHGAANLLLNAENLDQNIIIVVDCDCDGYTSAAIIINYLYKINPEYTKEHVDWIHHKGKEHGLKDVIDDILNSNRDYKLVICPDSASNDLDEHIKLREQGIGCIVLDHHEYDPEIAKTSPAYIINVQGWEHYPNKSLTGAGVAYKFVGAYEDFFVHGNQPTEFMDICALGNCGDMADYRNIETRAMMNVGFSNITNPFFLAMSTKNKYSIDKMNGINYYSMAFYVVPFINAIVRSGTMEEKEIVFRGMLTMHAFEKVETTKRGCKGQLVPLYEEAVLTAERVKRRQTKLQDESMAFLEKKIKDENLLEHSIILLLCEPGQVEKNIAGLCANKIQAKYQRPCAILTRSKTFEDKETFFRGSMRNYSLSEITNLKDKLEETGKTEFVAGRIDGPKNLFC